MKRPMHFVLIAVGSRGDVQPFIALGLELQKAGHRAQIAAFEQFGDLVRAYGLEFVSLGTLPLRFTRQNRFRLDFTGITGRILFWLFCRKIVSGYLGRFVEVCTGAEVLLYSRLAFPVYHLAEKWGIPCFYATPVPHTPTDDFVDPLFANSWLARYPRTRRFSFHLEEQLTLQVTARAVNHWRRHTLQMKPVQRRHLAAHRAAWTSGTLYGYSTQMLPRPIDWPDNIEITGFWFLDHLPDWKTDPELERFLATGPAPVYIGFGSMEVPNRNATIQLFVRALAQTGQRGIIATGSNFTPEAIPVEPHIFYVNDVPQDWLFLRVRAVIHHGGVGTMAAALRAGVPSLIIPINYDQPFWGRLIAALGLGVKPIPIHNLSKKNVSDAIHSLTTDRLIREQAVAMKAKLESEHGCTQAIDWMQAKMLNR